MLRPIRQGVKSPRRFLANHDPAGLSGSPVPGVSPAAARREHPGNPAIAILAGGMASQFPVRLTESGPPWSLGK